MKGCPIRRHLPVWKKHRELYKNPNRRRAEFHLILARRATARKPRDPGRLAAARRRLPSTRSASPMPVLRQSMLATRACGTRAISAQIHLKNLELHQLPIESVREIGRSFDLVVVQVCCTICPTRLALCALRDVLRPSASDAPDGLRHDTAGPEFNMISGVLPPARNQCICDGSAKSRRHTRALPTGHPILGVLRRADFRRPEAMADALLHPQDRAYTVPETVCMARSVRHVLGSLDRTSSYLAQCGYWRVAHTL